MRIFLAILLTAATLAGCAGTSFDWEQARAVRVGMTTQEVEAVLGKPYMVQSLANGTQTWIWSHGNGIRAVPVGEAMVACVLADHYLRHRGQVG